MQQVPTVISLSQGHSKHRIHWVEFQIPKEKPDFLGEREARADEDPKPLLANARLRVWVVRIPAAVMHRRKVNHLSWI